MENQTEQTETEQKPLTAEMEVAVLKGLTNPAELPDRLNQLKARAMSLKYVNVMPRLPKKSKPNENTMRGFYGRLQNWMQGLVQLELQAAQRN